MKGPASSAGGSGGALPLASSGSRPGVAASRKGASATQRAAAKEFQGLLDAAGAPTPAPAGPADGEGVAASKARAAAAHADERPGRARRPRGEPAGLDAVAQGAGPALVALVGRAAAPAVTAPEVASPTPAREAASRQAHPGERRPSPDASAASSPSRRREVAPEPALEATPRPLEAATPMATIAPTPTAAPDLAPLPPPAAVTGPVEPPRVVDASQTLLQLAMTDSSLTLDVHRQVVNVALTTEATGALELELRLRDGRAHVMVTGPSAPLVAQHAPALREVLAQQGLSLGDFATSQQQRQPAEAPERESAPPAPSTNPAGVTGPSRSRRHEGRIDVEA